MNSERELLRKRYYDEIERKNNFEGSLSFPITIITIYATYSIYILKKLALFNFTNFDLLYPSIIKWCSYSSIIKWAHYISFIIFIFFFIRSIIFLVKAIYNYDWVFLPLHDELKNFWDEFVKYYNLKDFDDLSKEEKEEKINEKFNVRLDEHYIQGLNNNLNNNDEKALNLHKTYKFLVYSLFPLFFMSFFMIYTIL